MSLLAAYQALLEASRRQLAALEADDDPGFTAATDDRERCFEAVRSREAEAAVLDAAGRSAVAQAIADVLEADRQLDAAMSAIRARNQEALSGLQTGLAALHSYSQAQDREALFIDRSQ